MSLPACWKRERFLKRRWAPVMRSVSGRPDDDSMRWRTFAT